MRQAILITLLGVVAASRFAAAESCERLSGLKLPDTSITSAQIVPAGAFTPPQPGRKVNETDAKRFKKAPAFCRITAEVRPAKDSLIRMEVWLPPERWNHKFRGQGNGGFAGSIGYGMMALAATAGYATAGTDTGHQGEATDSDWALGHPEKVTDFGYRAIHLMTDRAKAVIEVFYGRGAERSYFESCSDGGREALMEAQRFPADYDGIIAGAPANYWTHLLAGGLYAEKTLLRDPGSYIPESKLPAIAAGVRAACDARDGVADGIVNDPRRCRFDPSSLLCKGAASNSCLTPSQVESLRRLYSGARDSKGKQIFPGLMPGGEEGDGGWKAWVTGSGPGDGEIFKYVNGFFKNMVYEDPSWNLRSANIDDAVRNANRKTGPMLNAIDPDLRPFEKRGGKLILYHGWNDPAIPALNTINYFESVGATIGNNERDRFVRLYMAPGMKHCAGGPGPDSFGQVGTEAEHDPQHDIYLALEQWVEKDTAPNRIVATKKADGPNMTRPLCPYPQVAKYTGAGDTNVAANFVCASE